MKYHDFQACQNSYVASVMAFMSRDFFSKISMCPSYIYKEKKTYLYDLNVNKNKNK